LFSNRTGLDDELFLTFACFNPKVSTASDQKLDNIWYSTLDGSHDRRATVHCDSVHFGAVAQQVFGDPEMTFPTGEVQCSPLEIVRRVYIGTTANTKQILIL